MQLFITARDNEKVKEYCRLRDTAAARRESGCFVAEGVRLCRDLLQKLPCTALFITEARLASEPQFAEKATQTVYVISETVAQKMSDTKTPQGVFCVFETPCGTPNFAEVHRALLLENVQDPANVGALLRSAVAFGFDSAFLGSGTADAFNPKAVRASMSAIGSIRITQGCDIPAVCGALREQGVHVLAAALQNSVPLSAVDTLAMQKLAVLVGNEGNGLTDAAIAAATTAVRIPMAPNIESLNAGAAGAVLLWQCRAPEVDA